ncbi:MAG: hypothetical protein CUN52_11185, partial [Phototrophicales bacterium]
AWLYEMAKMQQENALARIEQLRENTALLRQTHGENVDDEALIQHAMDLENDKDQPGSKRHFARLTRLVENAGKGKYRTNMEALKAVRDLQMWLNEQEARLKKFLD